MKPRIYFITGVCGAGKSTTIPYLKSLFNGKDYDIHDFDERGVPENVDRKWRMKETEYWISLGEENIKNNISTIICGFANPKEAIHNNKDYIKFILLDADNETIKQRLGKRYCDEKGVEELKRTSGETPEEFIRANIRYTSKFRKICKQYGCKIIDTTNLTPEEVTKQIMKVII